VKEIHKPIFVVGCGRSGTTVFYRNLAAHGDVGWFSNYDSRFPRLFRIGSLRFLKENTLISSVLGKIPTFAPVIPAQESVGIFDLCGIRDRSIPLSEKDVRISEKELLLEMIERCLRYQRKKRFLNKNTNNGMRIGYLNEIFPDSLFIHVLRDGRANSNSYLNVKFFSNIRFWWWGGKLADWEKEGKMPIELAALHWKHNVQEIRRQKEILPKSRYMEVRYEDFTENPIEIYKKVSDFCELEWNIKFEEHIRSTKFENRNSKWQDRLSEDQKAILNLTLGDFLRELNYE